MGIHKVGATMKHSRLLLLSLYLSLPSVFSLGCELPACPAGSLNHKMRCHVCKIVVSADCSTKEIVLEPCGCPVCAKAEGEQCGGLCGVAGCDTVGICASFLTCELENPKPNPSGSLGVCVEKEVKKSFWQKIMDYISKIIQS